MVALNRSKVRGISEIDDRQPVPVGHDVPGMQVAMVETASEQSLVRPLLREVDQETLAFEGFIVHFNQLLPEKNHLGEIRQIVPSVHKLSASHHFIQTVSDILHVAVVRHSRRLLQDKTVHRRRDKRMDLHRMERREVESLDLIVVQQTSLAKIDGLLVNAPPEVDVRGLYREIKFVEYAGQLAFKRLGHSLHVCGGGLEYPALADNRGLYRRP